MSSLQDLRRILFRIDGRGYKAYKDIQGVYEAGTFTLFVDHVQGDPFAAPSRLRVRVPMRIAGFPTETFANRSRKVALADFLTRAFYLEADRLERKSGSGKSGMISIDRPGQEILERTSVIITSEWVEARFVVGLPAAGRRVLGKAADEILTSKIPAIADRALLYKNLDHGALKNHIATAEDADALRAALKKAGLVAFVADGSILPRRSGVDDRPLREGTVVPFKSPPSLAKAFRLPNRGVVRGMGVPEGITLIVGGGYHGKSTLLNAIELGVYNHIPGDGRELVVTVRNAVKIRAEDGRRVEKVNISPFINNLPFGRTTEAFCTENASGSTSQAANIIEALEAGAGVLLLDEDTSATNLMIRDHRMQELVAKEKEPITPFLDKVRQLFTDYGVSTVLVMGGSGDYFDVADTVVMMDEYLPYDVTERAKEIARKYRAERRHEGGDRFGRITPRVPLSGSLDPSKGKREVKIGARGVKTILFGTHAIDLSAVEQLVDQSQLNSIGQAMYYARERYMDGSKTLPEILDAVESDIAGKGLDVLDSRPMGDYAEFRRHELAAAINRLRTLRVRSSGGNHG
jgi:predicted ABC-class ATPase